MTAPPGSEPHAAAEPDALARFSPLVRDWFAASFAAPTPAQAGAWRSIAAGDHTLVVAPTGSGKTLAAFLSAINDFVDDRSARTAYDVSSSDASPNAGAHSVASPPRPLGPASASGSRAAGAATDRGRCRVLYISPLKALAVDIERNLRSPLAGIASLAAARGEPARKIDVAVRSGDTPPAQRAAFARRGADILITTPESLFLLLTSQARQALSGIETVIVDEIHAVAGTKRGAHLAVSLDRLDELTGRPAQRIGLSATVRPVGEVARFLAGGRPVTVVAPPAPKQVDIDVVVPVPDMTSLPAESDGIAGPAGAAPARASIWPHVEERIVDLIETHRSTIVFANSRRLAERLTARLNEIHAARIDESSESVTAPPAQIMAQSGASGGAPAVLARAHHGSVSREQRADIEDALKRGVLPAVVATSSLELGIDMGAVDLVIQVESPPSVASGLQRIGRAGHQVGAPSKGVLFPKFRGDLVSAAVASERMRAGLIEELSVVANPLDVAAQHLVSICAMDRVTVDEVHALLRRSAPFATLGRTALEAVLDMLSGRYPSEQFAELRPRLTWDRVTGRLTARPGAQRLAVTSGGTIPDRGLFGVFLAGTGESGTVEGAASDSDGATSERAASGPAAGQSNTTPPPAGIRNTVGTSRSRRGGRRVGELDEEMVYESRVGDVFVLGSSSWRIVDIDKDRVEVVPASGVPGRLPFWKADSIGRPAELGRAHGEFVREIAAQNGTAAARDRLAHIGLDEFAANNLLEYLAEQRTATGLVPDDATIVVERFRDELGDWRVVIHSPYGAPVHAPWALVIAARMRERYAIDVQAQHSDDGIVLRLPDVEYDGGLPDLADLVVLDSETVRAEVTAELGGSAVFAARFRECAARSLLLPRQQIGKRQPLWQQRQRAAQLLQIAVGYPEFPVVAEAARECLADVFDVASLIDLTKRIARREISVAEVTTTTPSPFARSLLFGYVAQFIYDGDSPLAERRAAALTVDPALLAELLGTDESPSLRDLLDADAIADVEASLQRVAVDRLARNDDEIADLARILGPLSTAELAARCAPGIEPEAAALRLIEARRLMAVRVAGEPRWADPADAAALRDALGVALPAGLAETFLAPVADPLQRLLGRFARTHGPFTEGDAAARFGIGIAVARAGLDDLVRMGRVVSGEFRPLGMAGAVDGRSEYVDSEVLRLIRRRSLAALRAEVEPVPAETLGVFLPAWNGIHAPETRGRPWLGLGPLAEPGALPRPYTLPDPGPGSIEAVLRAVEQLAGALIPASALESLILPARVPGYSPSLLDELMVRGEVMWSVHGAIGAGDAWLALHLADSAELTLPLPGERVPESTVQAAVLRVLERGGAFFFPALAQAVAAEFAETESNRELVAPAQPTSSPSASQIRDALWDLAMAGVVTGDTLAPLRARLGAGHTAHRSRPSTPRSRLRSPSRLRGRGGIGGSQVPGDAAGRWSLLPAAHADPTVRLHAAAEILLDRYGVVTRGSVFAEGTSGGFAGVYRVMAALEEAGRIRRGYFVEGLGAAQFADAGAVDRLRAMVPAPGEHATSEGEALVLASSDPANPYGAALPWPDPIATGDASQLGSERDPGNRTDVAAAPANPPTGHRPSRRAGALVALVGGSPVLYAERGGRTVLTFTTDPAALGHAAQALAALVDSGRLDALTITKIDGASVHGNAAPALSALRGAGFTITPRGLQLRAGARRPAADPWASS